MVRTNAAPDHLPQPRGQTGLYRVFWRWHFYAGVLVAPVLVVMAVTGAMYVFKDELERAIYRDTMSVTPQPSRVPLEDQLAAAQAVAPGGYRATRLELSIDPTRATAVLLQGKGLPPRRAYVNPHTGAVQGTLGEDNFFRVVLNVHRRLFIGTTGRAIVEVTTSWTIVLLVTGLYLWWPRKGERLKGVWLPRLRAKPYVVLRDLHTVAGVYLLPVALAIALTGLVYSLVWGSGYRYAADRTRAFAAFSDSPKSVSPPGSKPLPLDEAVRVAREHFPDADGFRLRLPQKPDGAVEVFARGETGPLTRGVVALDRSTGEVLAKTTHDQFPALGWWGGWNYPLHVGSVLGTPTKVVWLAACVVLAGLPVTGLWMWWKRRPAGRTGFPRRPNSQLPWWLVGAIVLLCVVLPMVGASVVLILLAEGAARLIRRRTLRPGAGPVGAAACPQPVALNPKGADR